MRGEPAHRAHGLPASHRGSRLLGGRLPGGVCTPQRTITARLDGDFTLAGRARVACVQGGQACVATWGAACSVTCPEGTDVTGCCSNGSACGGADQAPDFNILLVQMAFNGIRNAVYDPFVVGSDQEARGTATLAGGAARLDCSYFNINIPFP
ncbi:MAG: hypothetical protein R3F60_21145 [bacterium]